MTAIFRASTDLSRRLWSRQGLTLQFHFQSPVEPSVGQPQLEKDQPQGEATNPSSGQSLPSTNAISRLGFDIFKIPYSRMTI